MINSLYTLVMLQLKDKVDFSFLKSTKKIIFKTVYSVLFFALVTALIYTMFTLIVSFSIFSFQKTLNFNAYLVLMTLLFTLSFLSCLINVTKTLYFSKDNQVLMTMPVANGMIFYSKLIVCFIYELIKNITYILPFFIAYGLVMKLSIVFYIWSILSLIFITLLIIVICGLMSIPAMFIAMVFKRNRLLELITVVIVLFAISYCLVRVINLIPADIDLIRDWGKIYWALQDFLNAFSKIFAPFKYLLQLLTGMAFNTYSFNALTLSNVITFLVCIVIIVICIVSIMYLSKPLFLQMVSTPFEYKKDETKQSKKNSKHKALTSSAVTNNKIEFRTPSIIYNVLLVGILAPIAVLLQNKIIAAMDTRILGENMEVAFNILIILLLTLSSNVMISSAFSSEGNSSYLNKIVPVSYGVPLTGKLVTNSLICIISIINSVLVIDIFAKIGVVNAILLSLSIINMFIGHLYWSAELDVMNPQNRQYQTSGKEEKNPNELKSTIIAFALAVVFSLISFFLMRENMSTVFIKTMILSVIFSGFRVYLFYTKVRLYYKEK